MNKARGYIDWPMTLMGVAMAALFVLAICMIVLNQQRWDAFVAEHHCIVIGKTDGTTSVGVAPVISSNGNSGVAVITATSAGKTEYKCDDGVTYWRSN